MRNVIILVIGLLLGLFSTASGSILYVPSGYSTIQAAINAASNGDTVRVSDGTYTENINFLGKAIKVEHLGSPYNCIIDGNQSGSVVTFDNGETNTSILDGFTITNGTGTQFNMGGLPVVYLYVGGGIYCKNSSPILRNNVIHGNNLAGDQHHSFGGGIYVGPADDWQVLFTGTAKIINNTIYNNTCYVKGGGVCVEYCSKAVVLRNWIEDNYVYGFTTFANGSGGGLCFEGCSEITCRDNRIFENTAHIEGGGLALFAFPNTTNVFQNNMICKNTLDYYGFGAGVMVYGPTLTYTTDTVFVNNTIADNYSSAVWGGFGAGMTFYGIAAEVVNGILWGNVCAVPAADEMLVGDGFFFHSSITISYTDVDGGTGSCTVQTGSTLTWGSGNVNIDPIFMHYYNDDYHIGLRSSPVINIGNNNASYIAAKDIDQESRIYQGTVDMGADEAGFVAFPRGAR